MEKAWSLTDQKSRAEQKRAKSQASAGGWAPSPPRKGRLNRKASREKVVWTWRSPKRICFGRETPMPRAARSTASTLRPIDPGDRGVGVTSPGISWLPNAPRPAA
jgi:hypothetical protein